MATTTDGGAQSRLDLHCHTSASFDCRSAPGAVMQAAARRGLTHLAITDHDRIDGALAARDAAPPGLTIIVGEEVRSLDGDLIALYLDEAVPPGLSAIATIEVVHRQGGLVGVPHPFDPHRPSAARDDSDLIDGLVGCIDYVEAFNARVPLAQANQQAAEFARTHGLPGVAVSDAHTLLEVGIAHIIVAGRVSSAAELRLALAATTGQPPAAMQPAFLVRSVTPDSGLLQRILSTLRGRRT